MIFFFQLAIIYFFKETNVPNILSFSLKNQDAREISGSFRRV